MSQNPRKYIASERSVQKQSNKATYQTSSSVFKHYQNPFYESNIYSPTYFQNTHHQDKNKDQEMQRVSSESSFKHKNQYIKGNLLRRRNQGMVSTLKSDLQSLKMEVSKLMNKQHNPKLVNSKKFKDEEEDDQEINAETLSQQKIYPKKNQYDSCSDAESVTSERIIQQPLKKLESQFSSSSFDPSEYMKLENDLLKTELRNLKNKYNAKKIQLNQKCEALAKKNQYLEVCLQKSEQSVIQYKKTLQSQVKLIKSQLNQQMQSEIKRVQSQKEIIPCHDSQVQNTLIEKKMKELYEQLSMKNRLISSLNVQLEEIKGHLEKKTFENKKQVERSLQLSKQYELAKRENSRLQFTFENELTKRRQIQKQNQSLKEKLQSISEQLKQVTLLSSEFEELQKGYKETIQQYKSKQQISKAENRSLNINFKNLKQLQESNQEQISELKKLNSQFMHQIENLSKNLRLQKEKCMEVEQSCRRVIEQSEKQYQKQIDELKSSYEQQKVELSEQIKFDQFGDDINKKEKSRQVGKWKTQYKLLKTKYDELSMMENNKKEQVQNYYKSYKQSKSKMKVLEMRNEILEQSANEYIQKIQQIETQLIKQKSMSSQHLHSVELHTQQLERKIEDAEKDKTELTNKLSEEKQNLNIQKQARKQLEEKIVNMNFQNTSDLEEIIERIKKRISDQDQKMNKYIRQIKNKDALIAKLKKQVRQLIENHEISLQELKTKQKENQTVQLLSKNMFSVHQIKKQAQQEIEVERNQKVKLLNQNYELKAANISFERQMIQTRKQLQSICFMYNKKAMQFESIMDQIKGIEQEHLEVRKTYQITCNERINCLKIQLSEKKKEIDEIRKQNKRILMEEYKFDKLSSFDQTLKLQIQTLNKFREQINKKNEDLYKLKDNYSALRSDYDNLKSDFDIAKLKALSEKKNNQIIYEIQIQNLKNLYEIQQKKVSSLEDKIRTLVEENKKKDTFLQQYVMGKKLVSTDKQSVLNFLKQYEIALSGKSINEKFKAESQEIENLSKYNFTLIKQLAEIKEKLILYEAVSDEKSESYASPSKRESSTFFNEYNEQS